MHTRANIPLHDIELQVNPEFTVNDARSNSPGPPRDSLSEVFHDEIDAWARHAMGTNGFGDLP